MSHIFVLERLQVHHFLRLVPLVLNFVVSDPRFVVRNHSANHFTKCAENTYWFLEPSVSVVASLDCEGAIKGAWYFERA